MITASHPSIFKSTNSYQFFKALYYNCKHYLCDFSTMSATDEKHYLVDIEISGKGFLNIEMQQAGDMWKMINDTDMVDANLEALLSNEINKHSYHFA